MSLAGGGWGNECADAHHVKKEEGYHKWTIKCNLTESGECSRQKKGWAVAKNSLINKNVHTEDGTLLANADQGQGDLY